MTEPDIYIATRRENFETDGGLLDISSFFLAALGNGTDNFWDSSELPATDDFFDLDSLETAIIGLSLTLENGFAPILLNAEISSVAITTVPIPAAAWLFLSALFGLARFGRVKAVNRSGT